MHSGQVEIGMHKDGTLQYDFKESFDEDLGKEYFIIRNSWGEYYAELGFLKVVSGLF